MFFYLLFAGWPEVCVEWTCSTRADDAARAESVLSPSCFGMYPVQQSWVPSWHIMSVVFNSISPFFFVFIVSNSHTQNNSLIQDTFMGSDIYICNYSVFFWSFSLRSYVWCPRIQLLLKLVDTCTHAFIAKQVSVKVPVLSVYHNYLSDSKLLRWKENDVQTDECRAICHVSSNSIRAVGCVLIMLQAVQNGSAFHKLNDFFINPYPVLNLFVLLWPF